jgi:hypothetical protein
MVKENRREEDQKRNESNERETEVSISMEKGTATSLQQIHSGKRQEQRMHFMWN